MSDTKFEPKRPRVIKGGTAASVLQQVYGGLLILMAMGIGGVSFWLAGSQFELLNDTAVDDLRAVIVQDCKQNPPKDLALDKSPENISRFDYCKDLTERHRKLTEDPETMAVVAEERSAAEDRIHSAWLSQVSLALGVLGIGITIVISESSRKTKADRAEVELYLFEMNKKLDMLHKQITGDYEELEDMATFS